MVFLKGDLNIGFFSPLSEYIQSFKAFQRKGGNSFTL